MVKCESRWAGNLQYKEMPKPVGEGLVLDAITSPKGYMHDFAIRKKRKRYNSRPPGLSAKNTIPKLASRIATQDGNRLRVYGDGYYGSLELARALRERGIDYRGTLAANGSFEKKLVDKFEFDASDRGTWRSVSREETGVLYRIEDSAVRADAPFENVSIPCRNFSRSPTLA